MPDRYKRIKTARYHLSSESKSSRKTFQMVRLPLTHLNEVNEIGGRGGDAVCFLCAISAYSASLRLSFWLGNNKPLSPLRLRRELKLHHYWLSAVDILRNLFLTSTAEMLGFLQQLRDAHLVQREDSTLGL